jgi:hypothetical protein
LESCRGGRPFRAAATPYSWYSDRNGPSARPPSTIGFTGNGGVDAALLKRTANTQDASLYNSSHQSGLYVEAFDNAQSLQQAFGQVAAEVLKLTK